MSNIEYKRVYINGSRRSNDPKGLNDTLNIQYKKSLKTFDITKCMEINDSTNR